LLSNHWTAKSPDIVIADGLLAVPDRATGPEFELVAKPATVGVPEVVAMLLAAAKT
jgi:hypothetical protein